MKIEWLIKTLALVIIVLFFDTSLIPIVGSTSIEKQANCDSLSIETSTKEDSEISLITLEVTGLTGGDNWYGSDNSFTFSYESDEIAEIYYGIDGNWSLYTGTFNVHDGGEHILEWYAVNHEGNQSEVDGPFYFKVDKTKPEIELTYEVVGGNQLIGWEFELTAIASDSMIGMDRVEFYLNNVLQETVKGPGPKYTWRFWFFPIPHVYICAIAYDKAGNSAKEYLQEPTNKFTLKSSMSFSNPNKKINVKDFSNYNLPSEIVERKNDKIIKKMPTDHSIGDVFDPASVIIVFNREIGENDWINSNVSISIFYESDGIDEVYYHLDNESWILYTSPIVIYEDGIYDFSWYVIDSDGYTSTPKFLSFKVDITPPEINLIKSRIAINKVKFVAEVYDATSGIDRGVRFHSRNIEFFDDEYPYECICYGVSNVKMTAWVYDKAGNINSCSKKTWNSRIYSQQSLRSIISQQINQLFKNIILRHQIRYK